MVNEEKILIKQAQNGDRNAFRELVERHKRNVYFLALDLSGNRQDAEDISQEVFIKAYHSLIKFRGESKLSSWLYRITVNCFMDSRRKQQVLKTVSIHNDLGEETKPETHALLDEHAPDPVELSQTSGLQKHIQIALNRLSPRERSVFVLRHYQELPLKEIGNMLDIAEGTVKALLFRAIKRLQKELAFYQADL